MTPEDKEIYCYDCKQFLPARQFARRSKSKNGYQPRCYSCFSGRKKHWTAKKKQEELKNAGQLMLQFGN